jgi:sugar lactone lactonase YvrE
VKFTPDGFLVFSEATGAGGDGRIWKINEAGEAELFFTIKLADVDGFWAGDFAFDQDGNLYLSSGNLVLSNLYRVDMASGGTTTVFTHHDESFDGFVFDDQGLVYYSDGSAAVYCLNLRTGEETTLLESPSQVSIDALALK